MKGTVIAIERAPGLENPMIYPGFETETQALDFIKELRTCDNCKNEHQAGKPLQETHCGSHWEFTTNDKFNPSAEKYQSYYGPSCPILGEK